MIMFTKRSRAPSTGFDFLAEYTHFERKFSMFGRSDVLREIQTRQQ